MISAACLAKPYSHCSCRVQLVYYILVFCHSLFKTDQFRYNYKQHVKCHHINIPYQRAFSDMSHKPHAVQIYSHISKMAKPESYTKCCRCLG